MARFGALLSITLSITLSIIAVLIGGCSGPDVAHTSAPFVSDEVPWSFPVPSGWHVSTSRSEPVPNLRVGALTTNISTVRYSFDFDQMAPGPNSGQDASQKLGPSAAVVKLLLLWNPPDHPIRWNPADSSTTVARSPTGWHDDAQNPGWEFRERQVCLANRCVSVLEWHGPDASEDAIGWMERIAQSLQLEPEWTDPAA